MKLAPWRSPLAHALHRHRSQPHSRFFQLATVNSEGYPANRSVVFRGFLENSDRLQIITDDRSKKIEHIQHQPWGEVCWYFTKTREQFRFFGELIAIGDRTSDAILQQARQNLWREISDNARSQFAWPAPKQPRQMNTEVGFEVGFEVGSEAFSPSPFSPEQPLETFCLLLLDPQQVDHLELRGEPQNRWIYELDRDKNWHVKQVNP